MGEKLDLLKLDISIRIRHIMYITGIIKPDKPEVYVRVFRCMNCFSKFKTVECLRDSSPESFLELISHNMRKCPYCNGSALEIKMKRR